jgi:hypothetical protein
MKAKRSPETDAAHARFAGAGRTPMDRTNPAVSERQRRFMGAELSRKRAGKKTRTGMSESQLEDFARKIKNT